MSKRVRLSPQEHQIAEVITKTIFDTSFDDLAKRGDGFTPRIARAAKILALLLEPHS